MKEIYVEVNSLKKGQVFLVYNTCLSSFVRSFYQNKTVIPNLDLKCKLKNK